MHSQYYLYIERSYKNSPVSYNTQCKVGRTTKKDKKKVPEQSQARIINKRRVTPIERKIILCCGIEKVLKLIMMLPDGRNNGHQGEVI